MRGIGRQPVLQHNQLQVRVLPAHIGDEALRRLALTVVPGCAIRVLDWLGRQGKDHPVLGVHDHRRQHLVVILHAAIPVVLLAAVRTVDAPRGERSGAVDRKQIVTVPIRVLLQRLATLQRPEHPLEGWPRRLRGSTSSRRLRKPESEGACRTKNRLRRLDRIVPVIFVCRSNCRRG